MVIDKEMGGPPEATGIPQEVFGYKHFWVIICIAMACIYDCVFWFTHTNKYCLRSKHFGCYATVIPRS